MKEMIWNLGLIVLIKGWPNATGSAGDECGEAVERPSLKWGTHLQWIEERNGEDKGKSFGISILFVGTQFPNIEMLTIYLFSLQYSLPICLFLTQLEFSVFGL